VADLDAQLQVPLAEAQQPPLALRRLADDLLEAVDLLVGRRA
jgi:hypothetical protein